MDGVYPLLNHLRRTLSGPGPCVIVAILLPGGSVIALLACLARREGPLKKWLSWLSIRGGPNDYRGRGGGSTATRSARQGLETRELKR